MTNEQIELLESQLNELVESRMAHFNESFEEAASTIARYLKDNYSPEEE